MGLMPGHPYIPIVLNLKDKRVLIIGGGEVAWRKVQALQGRGARLTVIAPEVLPQIVAAIRGKHNRILSRKYKKTDLKGADLVFIMTDDVALNRKIAASCRKKGIWFNCATGAEQEFLMTSFFERQDLLIAVSTRGAVPFLAKAVRRHLEDLIDLAWGQRVEILKKLRAQLLRTKQAQELKKLAQMTLEQIQRFVDAGEALLR